MGRREVTVGGPWRNAAVGTCKSPSGSRKSCSCLKVQNIYSLSADWIMDDSLNALRFAADLYVQLGLGKGDGERRVEFGGERKCLHEMPTPVLMQF
jgi:hypothetical protein